MSELLDRAPPPSLLLASTSPQRRAILEELGLPFEVVAPGYEERDDDGLAPSELVRAHAAGKARSVVRKAAGRVVLGVDTAVVADGRVLGKPTDGREAGEMLALLSGRAHEVVAGLCLLGPGWEAVSSCSRRRRKADLFHPLNEHPVDEPQCDAYRD